MYSFFENKDDLFLQVFLRRGEQLLPAMEEVATSDDPPLDQLRRLVDLEVGFFRQHRHFARLYLRSSPSSSLPPMPVYEGFKANFERAMELQADVFRRGQKLGELRDGDPYVLARMLSGIVATYQLLDPATGSDDGARQRHAARRPARDRGRGLPPAVTRPTRCRKLTACQELSDASIH